MGGRTLAGLAAVGLSGIAVTVAVAALPTPSSHGKPRPETLHIERLRVDDPQGGLPWGLRRYRTTTGLICLEAGRRGGDAIGVLGLDGSFQPTALESGIWLCTDSVPGDPPSSIGSSVAHVDTTGAPQSCTPGPGASGRRCDATDTRTLVVALAGPGLASARLVGATRRRIAISHHDGALLAVLPGTRFDPPDIRLSFHGGCDRRKRRILMGYAHARRRGCRVEIPLYLGD
jgi:hypothetical protein